MNPYVSELALYDIQGTPGVAADISHINSKAKTKVNNPPSLVSARDICSTSYDPSQHVIARPLESSLT